MSNKYFPEEKVGYDDLFYVCYMIERVARRVGHRNQYVVGKLTDELLWHYLSLADVLHSENPEKIEDEWISELKLRRGRFDITDVRTDLNINVPRPAQMAAVYARLIEQTMEPGEDYIHAIRRVYSNQICRTIDNYNCSAFYEPSYGIARAYREKGF
ncbi:MAG: hypothetical protein KBS80_00350 [Bacteroidales bacterium]|nr:hypothetical protein [Candidatus Cryptobacteroides choladohippi]